MKTPTAMNLIKFLGILSVFLICTCKGKKVDYDTSLNTISFDFERDLSESADILDLIDSIQVVKLETQKDYLISKISKISYDKDYIYILDDDLSSGALFKYNHSGEFVQKISRAGKGPEEYIRLGDFLLVNDQLILLDAGRGKVIFFSKNGEFIKEFSVEETYAEKLGKVDANHFAVFNENDLDLSYNIHIIDSDGNTVKKLMKVPAYLKNKIAALLSASLQKSTTYFDGKLLYTDSFSNDIFQVGKDSVTVRYRFDFGEHSFDYGTFLEDNRQYGTLENGENLFLVLNKKDVVHHLDNFNETSKYLYFTCSKKGKTFQFYYDKSRNKPYILSNSGTLPHIYSYTNQNTFVSVLESYVVEDMKNLDLTNLSNNKLFSKIIPLVKQTSASDNPILITYYFK